ncbi:KTSC domain-containing protein [Salsuginibacillus halophilus]|uniref:KTSC domain-containing protein n=1 Tax=Salsuginibacillus halophilus TaxID=517424 RepID=A0A2P8HCV2_9BACI|nr:KTSC domain-containing protein [Salsuginibacillus halophilus]PSL43951.1 KTSC domain-containing protein [Salsuginibacillus halophilus]
MNQNYEPMGSSQIQEVKYDKRTRTLYVKMKNGKTYIHYDVPELEHVSLQSNSEQENYYLTHIYDSYRMRTIEP